jgi:DNA mismatch repair protein MutS
MLLLFRVGDFYELFEADAEKATKLLGLTLTTRDGTLPMAGFPHHALESYLHKLLRAGLRVAICDQVEDSSAAAVPRQDITRVVTPGADAPPATQTPLPDKDRGTRPRSRSRKAAAGN